MALSKYSEWRLQTEDDASDNARRQAALGLGPPIPDAAINSGDTAPPWQQKRLLKKKKGKKKKKPNSVNKGLDAWLKEVDELKKDIDAAKAIKDKKPKDDEGKAKEIEKPEAEPAAKSEPDKTPDEKEDKDNGEDVGRKPKLQYPISKKPTQVDK